MLAYILEQIMPLAHGNATVYAEPLTVAMKEFAIDNAKRQAAFLAQVCHESKYLLYTQELASGSAYDDRVDLGNTELEAIKIAKDHETTPGRRWKGRGLLQVTGFANYKLCGEALKVDLLSKPELLAEPLLASRSAGWFWHRHNLNQEADNDCFGYITKVINGGYNGLDSRIKYWILARRVLGL